MLSYRHAFHAGNHADVLKHFLLIQLLDHLNQKDKPYLFVDTHAGAGRYSLEGEHARKNAEYLGGIGLLWERPELPSALARYVERVRSFNREGRLRFYPGSPALAAPLMRATDRLQLFELHPTDFGFLRKAFAPGDRRISMAQQDGFAALKALLPPPSRRALVLIDPPYERREDYGVVVDAMTDALRRFPAGCYAIWYPRLQKTESKQFVERLGKLAPASWLHVWLDVQRPARHGYGMHGSGMYIVNPPWTLPATLAEAMPVLADALALDERAGFGVEQHIP